MSTVFLCLEEVVKDIVKRLRVNESIRAREVRLVGEVGEQLGIMPLTQAQEIARKRNLDLVEVAANAQPPVCRLLDYGKYKYEQEKRERELKRGQKASLLREVRLRPWIGEHDFGAKARLIKKLLDGGDKVRVVVFFRGREITHPETGWRLLQRMAESLGDSASVDGQPVMQGKRMSVTLSPVATGKTKVKQEIKEA